jgi:hypothetical protein
MGQKQQNRARVVLAILILFLLAGTTWAVRGANRAAKAVPMNAETEALYKEQRSKGGWRSPSAREEMRKKEEALSSDQREALRQQREKDRKEWMEKEHQKMDNFFAMTPEQQRAELDKEIDRMQQRSERKKDDGQGKGPRSDGQAKDGGSGGDPSAKGGGPSLEQRDARMREMLNHTTPEQRAQWSNYRLMMQQRMQERGITPPSGGRGGPGGGGPGGGRRGP